jgi:hypothetical protein
LKEKQMKTLSELVPDLEKLLEFCKANGDLPASASGSTIYLHLSGDDETQRAHLAQYVRALGNVSKKPLDDVLWVDGRFGSLQLSICCRRAAVCHKVVKTKLVPEQVLPASEAKVIPAHEEEVVEWDCGSILAPSEPELATR